MSQLQRAENHDPHTGRFLPGNLAAGRSLSRSEALWGALADAKLDLVSRLRSDLGMNGDAAATLEGLLEAYAEARLLRSSMFARLVELGGPITVKGKSRPIFAQYLGALDREQRLALALGLERKAKPLPSVAQFVADAAARERAE